MIRTATDSGMVVITDPRVTTKPYGQKFLDSLPECHISTPPPNAGSRRITDCSFIHRALECNAAAGQRPFEQVINQKRSFEIAIVVRATEDGKLLLNFKRTDFKIGEGSLPFAQGDRWGIELEGKLKAGGSFFLFSLLVISDSHVVVHPRVFWRYR